MTQAAHALYPVVRGLLYLLLLTAVGTEIADRLYSASFATVPAVGTLVCARLRQLQRWIPWLLLIMLLARGVCQVASFLEPGDPITWPLISGVLLSGGWGHAWLLQVAGAAWWSALTVARRGAFSSSSILLLLILIGQTGTGHPAGDRWPGWSGRLVDLLHLGGAGLWLGTLGVLVATAIPRLLGADQRTPLARLVSSYSRFAQTGAALVIASGVTAAIVDGRSVGLAWQSHWGRLLFFKLIAMSGVVALGWFNWKRVTPDLNAERPGGANRLLWAVRAELLLGLVMLALTAFLVVSALPGEG